MKIKLILCYYARSVGRYWLWKYSSSTHTSARHHTNFFFEVAISPRVVNGYSSNIQDIFFCRTDINIYKHVSISYDSCWQRQMVFMEFDWKMTHTSFFRWHGTHRVRTWWWQEFKNTNQNFCKFKTLQVGKNRANLRVQSQLHQTIFGGSIENRKQGTFSLFIYQKLTSPTTCDQGLNK